MKKALSILLVMVLLLSSFAGCINKSTPVVQETMAKENVNSAVAKDMDFQQYISSYASNATDTDIRNLSAEYDKIQEERNIGSITEQEYTEKMYNFDDTLRAAKIYVPYKSLAAYAYAVKTMSQEDRTFIEQNNENFLSTYSQAHSEESLLAIYEQGKEIFKKHGLNLEELISSIQSASYNFALFKVEGDTLELDADRNSTLQKIDESTKEKYIHVFSQIRDFIPEDIRSKVTSFLVFASGSTSAFAGFDDLEQKNFRIGIDTTSMLDGTGNLIKEQREVLVHETAHIITLNNTQISSKQAESGYANKNEEFLDRYQKGSYLYSFFQRFWADTYEEYLSTTDASAFYNKYKTRFVSDYAAIAPEEDIAESFRVFVTSDQPTSDSIKDQKVRFFYEYKEFLKWREEIRNALSK